MLVNIVIMDGGYNDKARHRNVFGIISGPRRLKKITLLGGIRSVQSNWGCPVLSNVSPLESRFSNLR